MKAAYGGTLVMRVYSLERAMAEHVASLAPEFLGRSASPAASAQIVEGLPSADATVAIELVAVGP